MLRRLVVSVAVVVGLVGAMWNVVVPAYGAPSMANLQVDNLIRFTSPGFNTAHDINVIDNAGALRFYGCPELTVIPQCAAIQFFGNFANAFGGQMFLDSGAETNAAIIMRTATAGNPIAERLRISADGIITVNAFSVDGPIARFNVAGNAFGIQSLVTGSGGLGLLSDTLGIGSSSIVGRAFGSGGYGVEGIADNNVDAVGVYGSTTSGVGVVGDSFAEDGVGVLGLTAFGDLAASVYGSSLSGRGVYGDSFATDGAGVVGVADGAQAAGIAGFSTSGLAGYFEGNVQIDGGLNVTGAPKNFVIDHPLDPANKNLYHAAMEGPDMYTIYRGNATTNGAGEVIVELPAYFQALNRDPSYQLTPVGQQAQTWVSSEVSNNRFTIKTDKPNVKVSWQVTGIRNDAYAQAHPYVAERPKTPEPGPALRADAMRPASPSGGAAPVNNGVFGHIAGQGASDRFDSNVPDKVPSIKPLQP